MAFLNQKGNSVMSVIMAASIGGITTLASLKILENGFRAQASLERRGDRESLRRHLLSAVSCPATVPTGMCTYPGQLLELKQMLPDGTTRILATSTGSGTKWGRLSVRAECNTALDGVVIRATMLHGNGTLVSTADSDFVPDPLTKRLVKWSDSASLVLPNAAGMCGSAMASANPSGLIMTNRTCNLVGTNHGSWWSLGCQVDCNSDEVAVSGSLQAGCVVSPSGQSQTPTANGHSCGLANGGGCTCGSISSGCSGQCFVKCVRVDRSA